MKKVNGLPVDTVKTYTVTEDATSLPGGVSQTGTASFTVKVKLHDDGNGQITVTEESDSQTVAFINTYAANGSIEFDTVKALTGRDLAAGEFSFQLKEGENVLQTVTNAADGKITFSAINYTLADLGTDAETGKQNTTATKTYTIHEVVPETKLDGVTYTENDVTVTVVLTDDGKGTISAVATYNPENKTFTNTYAAEGDITLSGTKTLEGRTLTADDKFDFTLYEATEKDGKLVLTEKQTVQNNGAAINFTKIEYTLADVGIHTYVVKETSSGANDITVSTEQYVVVVKVSDAGDGTLNVEKTDNYNALNFTNTYASEASVTFEGTKKLSGRDVLATDIFSFTITEGEGEKAKTWSATSDPVSGKINYPTISYTKDDAGVHTYKVTETSEGGNGITVDTKSYEVVVKVINTNGVVTAEITSENKGKNLNFTNTYKAEGELEFAGRKTLENKTLEANQFTFTVSENGEVIQTVTNGADGKIAFKKITYTLDNTGKHVYTVKETTTGANGITVDVTEYEVTVVVTDKGDGTLDVQYSSNAKALNFTNTYEATGSVTFEGTKTLTGRTLKDDEFTFTVSENGKVIQTVTNGADGKIGFEQIDYTLADVGDHTYTVKETSTDGNGITVDTKTYTVKVNVADKGDGTLTVTKLADSDDYASLNFTNTYKAVGEITFAGIKTIEGREMTDADVFNFEISDGMETWKATNDATGKINYPTITYMLDLVNGINQTGTHTYTVKETSVDGNGITVDTNSYTVVILVIDNEDGTLKVEVNSGDPTKLDFVNTYTATGKLTLEAEKILSGRTLTAGKFTFELSGYGITTPQRKTNDADGKVTFDEITYSLADVAKSPLTYVITEKVPATTDSSYDGTVVYDEHTEIITVTLTDDGKGNITAKPDKNGKTVSFTNTYGETTAKVVKIWDDANDAAGFRPGTVTMILMANNERTSTKVNLPTKADATVPTNTDTVAYALESGNWTATVSKLPKYKDGDEIVYSWIEELAVAGYSMSELNTVEGASGDVTTTIKNTYNPEKFCLTILKVWDDANDQDKLRPESITVKLFNGTVDTTDLTKNFVQDVTLKAEDNWTAIVTGLPVHAGGEKLTYYWYEDAVTNYGTKAQIVQADLMTRITSITNTHTPDETEVAVTKVWADGSDHDGLRPEGVDILLRADGEPVKMVTLTTSNVTAVGDNWTYTFDHLPKYNGSTTAIDYTVEEINVPAGYKVTVTGDAKTGYTVTNTHAPVLIDISATKVWDDADNQDGKRDDITLVLSGSHKNDDGNTVALTIAEKTIAKDAANLTVTWTGLSKYVDGHEVTYTVTEKGETAGKITLGAEYTVTYSGNETDGFTVTKSYEPEKTSVPITKTWVDSNDQDGKRPATVVITLTGKANDETVVTKSYILSAADATDANNWSYTFTDLPKYKNGTEIVYTVDENVVTGYDKSIAGTSITNTYAPEKVDLSIEKIWQDNNDQDKIRPTQLNVYLHKIVNGEDSIVETFMLKEDNGWKAEKKDQPKYENGVMIYYYWTEDTVPNYSLTTANTETTQDKLTTSATRLTNTYTPGETSATVKKVWNDANDIDGKRPTSVTVTLTINGDKSTESAHTKTLDAGNGWTATIEHLPEKKDGVAINYGWAEETVHADYTVAYATEGAITTVTNTHTPEETETTVTKVWEDNNDQDGIRPDHIDLKLLADGTQIKTVRLEGAGNSWSYTEEHLPKYAFDTATGKGGHEVVYTWEEYDLPAGYTKSQEGNKITNSYTPETTKVTVEKSWDDANNQDGKRADVVATVQLQKTVDGTTSNVGEAVTVGAADGWSKEWTDLPVYEGGKQITYSVVETLTTANGYTLVGYAPVNVAAVKTDSGKIVVTNKYTPETQETKVEKIWDDNNNHDGKRPETLTVTLVKTVDGETTETAYTLSAGNNWKVELSGLAKYEGGKEVSYSWTEKTVPAGYNKTEIVDGTKTTITNKHDDEKTSATVVKAWEDNENALGLRPESVEVTLYADNVATETKVTLPVEGSKVWSYTAEDLMKYNAMGDLIAYSWMEDTTKLTNGYFLKSVVTADGTTTITNKYNPETVTRTVVKVWDDDANSEGFRPGSVEVKLYKGTGEAKTQVGDAYTLNAANNWSVTTGELPKHENGAEIAYYFEETVPANYTLSNTEVEGTTTIFTNSRTPEKTSTTVEKVWADNSNQDGKRPDHVDLKLYKQVEGGEKTQIKTIRVSGTEDTWSYTESNLPKYESGKEIVYSWEEYDLPAGYTKSQEGNKITNSYTPETTKVTVKKVWDDVNNQDGKRPKSLTVTLDNTGVSYSLTEANKWTVTVDGLPKYENGDEITYTWTEADLTRLGYTLTNTETAGYVTTLTNTYTPETTKTTVTKVWDDKNHEDKRPEAVVMILTANGETVTTVTLDASNNWTETVEDLPKYKDGRLIGYSWDEATVPTGYVRGIKVDGSVTTITNTYQTGELVIKKTFSGIPADKDVSKLSFTITGPDFEKTVTYADFTMGEYKLSGLVLGKYRVVEKNAIGLITNYSLDLSSSKITGTADVTIANTAENPATIKLNNIYTEDKGDLVIAKEWCFSPADAVNVEEMKQLKVTVTNSKGKYVKADGTLSDEKVELTIEDGSRLIIRDLPIDTYTVTETNADDDLITGYSVNSTVPSVTTGTATTVNGATATVVLKNNYTRDTGSLVLKKTWDLTGVSEVPEEVKNNLHFVITAPDVVDFETMDVYYAAFTKNGNNGTLTIDNLPVGEYTVTEMNADTVLASYGYDLKTATNALKATVSVDKGDEPAEIALTNTYVQHRGLTIVKTFEGLPAGADVSGLNFSITGPEGFEPITVTYQEFTNGAYTISDLPEGEYTVTETNAEELIARYSLDADASTTKGTANVKDGTASQVALKNVYKPDQGALTIRKTFRGTPGGAALGDPTFTVTGADGFSKTVKYSEFTNGAYTFSGLTQGYYTVTETVNDQTVGHYVFVPGESTTTVSTSVMTGYTSTVDLVNAYQEQKGSLTIQKTFTGAPEGANLAGLVFEITGPNGYSNTVSYASFNGGAYTIKDLTLGTYNVREIGAESLIAGYSLDAGSTTTGSFTLNLENRDGTVALTNKYNPEQVKLIIKKTFGEGSLNATDNVDHLAFRILGPDGLDETVTYGQFTNGIYEMSELKPGQYTVYELNAGFLLPNLTLLESSVTGGNALVTAETPEQTIELKNNYRNSNTSVAVMKVWNDMENVDGSRPESLNVSLSNGTETVRTVTLNESNGWAAEVNDLPLYKGAEQITYSWTEQTVAGYTLTNQHTIGNMTVLTNTHIPEMVSTTVTKVWDDNDNAAGLRPATLRVTLSNGQNYTLSAANNWTVTVNNLPKYRNGALVNYSWSEQSVLGYTQANVVVTGDVTIFTNTYRMPLPPTTPTTPDTPRTPTTPKDDTITIEDYATPLGIEVIINHVGDCFD